MNDDEMKKDTNESFEAMRDFTKFFAELVEPFAVTDPYATAVALMNVVSILCVDTFEDSKGVFCRAVFLGEKSLDHLIAVRNKLEAEKKAKKTKTAKKPKKAKKVAKKTGSKKK